MRAFSTRDCSEVGVPEAVVCIDTKTGQDGQVWWSSSGPWFVEDKLPHRISSVCVEMFYTSNIRQIR